LSDATIYQVPQLKWLLINHCNKNN